MLGPRYVRRKTRIESHLLGSRGESLVQLLVGMAIMSILLMAMVSMMSKAMYQTRAVSEKLDILNLENLLIGALADGSVCKYVLNNPAPLTFDSTSVSPATPQTITLPARAPGLQAALYSSIANPPTNPPGTIVTEVGSTIGTSNAVVRSIQLQITQGSAGTYRGNWLINFDDATTKHNMRPLSIATLLSVDDVTNPGRATVNGCSTSTGTNTAPLKMVYYKMFYDQTNDCRSNPGVFTRSTTSAQPSLGDIVMLHSDVIYRSALYEMQINAPAATAVTQFLNQVDNAVYFWLNGAKIAEETTAGVKYRTITWNLIAGSNLVQIVTNNCDGGGEQLLLIGDFFARYPQLEFVP